MALSIKIGGTTYRGTTDYSIKQQGGAVSTTSLNVLLGSNPVPLVLQVAQVYLDGVLFFAGLIQSVSTPEYSSTYETKVFSIDVSSLECLMNHRLVTKNFYYYTYTSWTQVIQYLFDNYISQEGITLGSISATSETFDSKYSVSDKKLYDVLSDIADAIGNASWWISADRKFYFKIATDFTEVVPPTHLTKLKLSEKIGDIRTVEKMTGASSGITATETNATLLATLAARTGGSGKIEIAENDSDIHSDSKAATEAAARLTHYAESEKTITCICHDLSKSEIYNLWPLDLTINGVEISGDYVVTDRTISDHGPDAFSISVTLKNNNYFSRYGYSLKRVATATNKVSSSILDICADNKLTASEKPGELSNWNIIAAEKSVYDSEADSHSVSRVAYDSAFQALATYLNGGTTWTSGTPLWFVGEHITETTDINGGDYDDAWQAYYSARTGLEESIRSAIQSPASSAASAAASAQSAAEAAQTAADAKAKVWVQGTKPVIGTRPNAINGDTLVYTAETISGHYAMYLAIDGDWQLQDSALPTDPIAYWACDEVPEIPDATSGIIFNLSTPINNSNPSIYNFGPSVDLSSYAGQTVEIRFVEDLSNGVSGEWLVLYIWEPSWVWLRSYYGSNGTLEQVIIDLPSTYSSYKAQWFHGPSGGHSGTATISEWYIGNGKSVTPLQDNSGNGYHASLCSVFPYNNHALIPARKGTVLVSSTQVKSISAGFWTIRTKEENWDYLIALNGGVGKVFLHNNSKGLYIEDNGQYPSASCSTIGRHFWYLAFDNTTATLYRDAVVIGVITLSFVVSSLQWYVTRPGEPTANYELFGGCFFDYILSDAEVRGLYINNGNLPKVYTLANWQYDQAVADDVIDPSEKQAILTRWLEIYGASGTGGTYSEAVSEATSAGVSYAALTTAYNALYAYLYSSPGVLIAAYWDCPINVSTTTFNGLWTSYANALTALQSTVSSAVASTKATSAQTSAQSYADTLNTEMQAQVDRAIVYYTQTSDPSTDWTTTALKNAHIGDLWRTATNAVWQQWSGTAWATLSDPVAQEAASTAQSTASSKTTVYATLAAAQAAAQVGDLFLDSGLMYRCTVATSSITIANSTRITPKSWGQLSTAPTSGMIANDTYYNTTSAVWYYYSGSAWVASSTSGITYSIVPSVSGLTKNRAGTLTPASFTIAAKALNGTTLSDYAGRFMVYESTDGTTYTLKYTSSSNESSVTYTPTTGIASIKIQLYLAGGTTYILATAYLSVPYDATVSSEYLGKFHNAHPTSNVISGDWWVVYSTDTEYASSALRGVYYMNGSTATRISLVSGETGYTTDAALIAKAQACMNDVAWAEKNSYGVASNYGISAYYAALAVCTALIENLYVKHLNGADGTFSGALSAATGTFAGDLSAAGGTFKGALQAATGTFAGALSAASGSFSGTITASSGGITGSLSLGGALLGTHVKIDANYIRISTGTSLDSPAVGDRSILFGAGEYVSFQKCTTAGSWTELGELHVNESYFEVLFGGNQSSVTWGNDGTAYLSTGVSRYFLAPSGSTSCIGEIATGSATNREQSSVLYPTLPSRGSWFVVKDTGNGQDIPVMNVAGGQTITCQYYWAIRVA